MTQTIQRDLLTESRLEMLTRFHSDTYPVVSLYLDLRPEERQGGRLRTKLKSMIRQREADLAAEPEGRREAFKAAADQLLDMLTQEANLSGRGLAVYSAPGLDLW